MVRITLEFGGTMAPLQKKAATGKGFELGSLMLRPGIPIYLEGKTAWVTLVSVEAVRKSRGKAST